MKALLTRKKKNDKGFSLIELIIAIAILVILTGLLAPNILRYVEKSREAKDMQTLDTVYEAVQIALTEENLTLPPESPFTVSSDIIKDGTDGTLYKELYKTLGSQSLELVSKKCKGKAIKVTIASDNAVTVYVEGVLDFKVPADSTNSATKSGS